jgi:hypothetical protein
MIPQPSEGPVYNCDCNTVHLMPVELRHAAAPDLCSIFGTLCGATGIDPAEDEPLFEACRHT